MLVGWAIIQEPSLLIDCSNIIQELPCCEEEAVPSEEAIVPEEDTSPEEAPSSPEEDVPYTYKNLAWHLNYLIRSMR